MRALLSSGRIRVSEKLRLLEAGLKSALSPAASVEPCAAPRCARQNSHLAPEIQRAYQQLADDRRGIAHAVVTTAVPLSDDERAAITARLSSITGKQVDVTPVVDESIIGGSSRASATN